MHELVIIVAEYLIVVPVIAVIYCFWTLKSQQRKTFIFELIATVIIGEIIIKIATSVHQDPRPFISDGVHPYFKGSLDNGFPSDHTAYSALAAVIVFRHFKKLGVGLFVLAALIGSARVIAGVHHGQDVVAGLVIAVLAGSIVALGQKFLLARPEKS